MFGRIDPLRLFDGAMIHPRDDVASGAPGIANRHGFAFVTEHNERAGRVEPDAGDDCRIDIGRSHGLCNGTGNGLPDILGLVLRDVAGFGVECERPLRGRDQPAIGVEHTGARTSRSDIDTDSVTHIAVNGRHQDCPE